LIVTSAILCIGLYKAGSEVESTFTQRTVEPTETEIFAGSNADFLIWTVLSETEIWLMGVCTAVAGAGEGVSTLVGGAAGTGIAAAGAGSDRVQPHTSTRSTARENITIIFFIV